MFVRGDLGLDRVIACLAAPPLRVGQEQALVAREAVDHRCRLAAQGRVVGVDGDQKATQVGNVLTEGQLAIDAHAGDGFVGVVLGGQFVRLGRETVGVFLCPPVAQAAIGVDLSALVVEAMGDFVSDDRADGAVVHRRVSRRIEEWRLQDASRKHDLVFQAAIVGVHRLRGHAPLLTIHRLAVFADLVGPFEGTGARHVAVKITRGSIEL